VLNVVTGYGEEAGAALSTHEGVRKLSFTGSTEVGKLIMRAASERIVPVSLELGGKSPSIVYPDANEDWVVDGIIAAMRFTRQSQSCTAGSRLLLHADIFDDFLGKLAKKTKRLKIGDPPRRGNRRRCYHQREAVQEGVRLDPVKVYRSLMGRPTIFLDFDTSLFHTSSRRRHGGSFLSSDLKLQGAAPAVPEANRKPRAERV